MELIQVDDIRKQIIELKKLVRVVDPGTHPLLTEEEVRELDFEFSDDMKTIKANLNKGLSFATNMKKFKKLIKTKGRFFPEVDVYTIDEKLINIEGLRLVHDRPGHASLVVTQPMKVTDLIIKLESLSKIMESIGRIKVSI